MECGWRASSGTTEQDLSDSFCLRSSALLRVGLAIAALLATAAIVSCSHSRPVSSASPTDPFSADAIISHYYQAIGGHDHLMRIDTRHMWGSYSEGRSTPKRTSSGSGPRCGE